MSGAAVIDQPALRPGASPVARVFAGQRAKAEKIFTLRIEMLREWA